MSNFNRGDEAVKQYRAADKKNLDDILDLVNPGGAKGTAEEIKDRAEKSGQEFDDVKTDLGIGAAPKGPGFFSRIGKAFRSFGKGVANLFGRKSSAPALDTGATLSGTATPSGRDRSESVSEDDDIKNNLNVTYTRAQGREAAAKLNAPAPETSAEVKRSLNVTMTPAEAKEAAKQLTHQQQQAELAKTNEKPQALGIGD